MPPQTVFQKSLRSALPAPVKTSHMIAPPLQLAHGFKIALNEIGATIQQYHSTLAFRGKGRCGHCSQPHVVASMGSINIRAVGQAVIRRFIKLHKKVPVSAGT